MILINSLAILAFIASSNASALRRDAPPDSSSVSVSTDFIPCVGAVCPSPTPSAIAPPPLSSISPLFIPCVGAVCPSSTPSAVSPSQTLSIITCQGAVCPSSSVAASADADAPSASASVSGGGTSRWGPGGTIRLEDFDHVDATSPVAWYFPILYSLTRVSPIHLQKASKRLSPGQYTFQLYNQTLDPHKFTVAQTPANTKDADTPWWIYGFADALAQGGADDTFRNLTEFDIDYSDNGQNGEDGVVLEDGRKEASRVGGSLGSALTMGVGGWAEEVWPKDSGELYGLLATYDTRPVVFYWNSDIDNPDVDVNTDLPAAVSYVQFEASTGEKRITWWQGADQGRHSATVEEVWEMVNIVAVVDPALDLKDA